MYNLARCIVCNDITKRHADLAFIKIFRISFKILQTTPEILIKLISNNHLKYIQYLFKSKDFILNFKYNGYNGSVNYLRR